MVKTGESSKAWDGEGRLASVALGVSVLLGIGFETGFAGDFCLEPLFGFVVFLEIFFDFVLLLRVVFLAMIPSVFGLAVSMPARLQVIVVPDY